MNNTLYVLKRSLIGLTLVFSMALLIACSNSPSEEAIAMYKDKESYTMSMTIELPDYTIESLYKIDGNLSYFLFDDEAMYQEETEEGIYRYSKNVVNSWEKTDADEETDPLIPNDSVVLNPQKLEPSMLELAEDERSMKLKEKNYEDVFGEKSGAILSFFMIKHDDHLSIHYTFNQEGNEVPVEVTIDAIGSTEVTLPI